MPLIRQCAWCRAILENGESGGEFKITHTICEPCCRALLKRAEMLTRNPEADRSHPREEHLPLNSSRLLS